MLTAAGRDIAYEGWRTLGGEENIAERYNIANAGTIMVQEENGLFIVKLPLVAPAKALQKV